MKLTQYEKETIINYSDLESIASIYTCNKAMITKLDKLCKNNDDFNLVSETDTSKTYTIPKKSISINAPRIISEEKRAEMSKRAKESLNKKQSV